MCSPVAMDSVYPHIDTYVLLEAAKGAARAKAPEIELLKFRAAAVALTIRHWRATDVMIG
jgi:hypothetical protein